MTRAANLAKLITDANLEGTLDVTGIGTFTDDIIIGDGKTIGSASDVDAITIASNGQLTLTQTLIGTSLDISGDIDVDGTTNLDVVDIDGALTQDGGAVFNEDSADVDFRVESNDSANMLFVNGGNNQVGIGVDAASTVFHVETSTDGTGVSGDDIYIAKFYNKEATDSRSYGVDIHAGSNSTDQALRCKTHDGGTQLFLVKGDGSATIANGLTLTDGDLVVASGHGIDFGANTGQSGQSSEIFHHYEEGTFTPMPYSNVTQIATSSATGFYTKIGNRVFVNGSVTRNDTASLTSVFQLRNLPFSSSSASGNQNIGGGFWFDTASSTDQVGFAFITNGENRLYAKTLGLSAAYITADALEHGRPLYFSAMYFVD
jgi:hypothetical protein